ncbi:MAG: hypothetical protein M3040_13520, partial [Bacteroidota bacterium]|nr:hypothetical protein [Bacteroidota bacterium]
QVAEAAIAVAESVEGGVKVVAASTSSTGCVGLGACFTAPIPSLIIEAGSNLILKIANVAVAAANVAATAAELALYIKDKQDNVGVSYESGSGDYAEWIPKLNPSEVFKPGDIIAMRDGKISKNTDNAAQLFVISFKPIVLGNMPKEGSEKDYEKVAFMGQVPVYVLGNVEKGDYIVTDGLGDGFGVAINPAKMQMEHYKKIVGVAWSSSTGKGISLVNVAVGLNHNDLANVLQEQQTLIKSQQDEINALKAQGQQTNNILAKLVPGFKEAAGIKETVSVKGDVVVATTQTVKSTTQASSLPSNMIMPDPSTIVYHPITNEQVEEMFVMAEKVFVEGGGKYNEHPFWKKIKSENGYKASMVNQVKEKMKNAVHYHEESNKKLSKN